MGCMMCTSYRMYCILFVSYCSQFVLGCIGYSQHSVLWIIQYHVGTAARAVGDATKPCIMLIVLSAAYLSSLMGVYYVIFCEYCTEFTGLDCTLPAQCDVYMCPVLSSHYCHHKVLCMSSLCCTTASACSMLCVFCSCCTTASPGCYVCLVCVALLPAQGAI